MGLNPSRAAGCECSSASNMLWLFLSADRSGDGIIVAHGDTSIRACRRTGRNPLRAYSPSRSSTWGYIWGGVQRLGRVASQDLASRASGRDGTHLQHETGPPPTASFLLIGHGACLTRGPDKAADLNRPDLERREQREADAWHERSKITTQPEHQT